MILQVHFPLGSYSNLFVVPSVAVSEELSTSLRYYTSPLHTASFVLPAFAHQALYGHDGEK